MQMTDTFGAARFLHFTPHFCVFGLCNGQTVKCLMC